MVRQAIASAVPAAHHYPQRSRPKLATVTAFIDGILEKDRGAPRKQRHTARRIHRRIVREVPEAAVAESTVREYVRERRRQMGLLVQDTFVPRSYDWGHEAQVDWYEAWVDLAGERTRVQVFAIRAMASGAAFHRAYLHATQQAFLEAHEAAFAYFGGVFRLLRYDNLKSAVSKILRGHRREETARFVAFRSHWRFAAEFCTPGEGHEKGGVEGEGGYFRRNHLVPVPDVPDLEAVNALLLAGCRADEARVLDGRTLSVGSAMATERDHRRSIPWRCCAISARCRASWSLWPTVRRRTTPRRPRLRRSSNSCPASERPGRTAKSARPHGRSRLPSAGGDDPIPSPP